MNEYQHPEFAPRLHTPVNDVYNLRDLLIRHYGFNDANVKLLLEGQATRAGILSALAAYRDLPLGPTDNLLVYFAGHGYLQPETEDGFWIPVDGTPDESSWAPVTEIRRIVKNIKAKHTLLVSDSCLSGALTRATVTLPTTDRYLGEVARKDSYQVITSGGLEPVADGGREGLSLFAYSLTSYLKNQSKPYVTAAQLYTDLAPVVSNASDSRQTPEHGKIPGTFDQNGQFIFARVDVTAGSPASAAASKPTPSQPAPSIPAGPQPAPPQDDSRAKPTAESLGESAPERASTDEAPLIVGGDVAPPTPVSRPGPVYPEDARQARIEGKVVLQAIIGKRGDIESVEVLKGVYPSIDQAAKDAVKQWKHRPTTMKGEPVRISITVVLEFTLE